MEIPPSKRPKVENCQEVEEKTQREWLLQCPETFIGGMEVAPWSIPLFGERTEWKTIHLSPALVHLFLELVVNSLDNGFRDDSQTYIHIDFKEGVFTISNDGSVPPVSLLPGSERYKISGCFGGFQCGSNFDNTKRRFTGGRNGIGAAAANTYSTKMSVSVSSASEGIRFEQEWKENMSVEGVPKITSTPKKRNEIKVTWFPDYAKFPSLSPLPNSDLEDAVSYLSHCASLCAPERVKVKLSGQPIRLRTPEQFCKALGGIPPFASDTVSLGEEGVVMRICVAAKEEEASTDPMGLTLGFVNSTPCSEGSHADYVFDKVKKVVEAKAKSKQRKGDVEVSVKPSFVRKNTVTVVKLLVDKPRFRSQSKSALDTPIRDWGWTWQPNDSFVHALEKSPLVSRALEASRRKSDAEAAKATKVSGKKHPHFGKYDAAGDLYKGDATLIVTEGDSAKNFATSAVSVVGRRKWGIYPVRGKFINARGVPPARIAENKEAKELMQILGLSPNPRDNVGSAISKLPYGRLMVLSDQDVDGSHIAALLYNLVEVIAPSLLASKPGFVCRFATALIRVSVTGSKADIAFYSETEYDSWRKDRITNGLSVGKATYYKGLGTSSASLAKEYFRNIDRNTVVMEYTGQECAEALDLFFNKDRSDDRKQFLSENTCESHLDYSLDRFPVKDFVHKELLPAYAWAAIERGIPSLDGLNNARRKILWGARTLGMTKDAISVANAAGKISSVSNYHHRGTAMENAIIGMAADYVGSGGNVKLFLPLGQFGTRHSHQAASAAYPKTKLNCPIHSLLYPPEDDPVLERVVDEGVAVEPVIYAPVIAMSLCFGSDGIAVGWSTKCPPYNPVDLVDAAEAWLDGKEIPPLVPFYRGFEGDVDKQEDGSFLVRGKCFSKGEDLHVTEIPPFRETDAYKEEWSKYAEGGVHPMDDHTDVKVHLVLKKCKPMDRPLQVLGLEKRVTFNNVYFLDDNNRVKKYSRPEEIVADHARMRLKVYEKRLLHQISECEKDAFLADAKAEYIRRCVDGSFVMKDHEDDDEASSALAELGFEESLHSTLLKMPGNSLTKKRASDLCSLAERKREELSFLKATTPSQVWRKELLKLREGLCSSSPSNV